MKENIGPKIADIKYDRYAGALAISNRLKTQFDRWERAQNDIRLDLLYCLSREFPPKNPVVDHSTNRNVTLVCKTTKQF